MDKVVPSLEYGGGPPCGPHAAVGQKEASRMEKVVLYAEARDLIPVETGWGEV